MDNIYQEEDELVKNAMQRMKTIQDIVIYGETDTNKCTRAGSISFNIRGMDHGLVASILNDYFNIAVRNECFCAHPYVKELILDDLLEAVTDITDDKLEKKYKLKAGMVRASFGIYNKLEDIDALINSLKNIVSRKKEFMKLYHVDRYGNYVHNEFQMDAENNFSVSERIKSLLSI